MEIEAYHQRENPSDISLPGVPELEWKQWMQQLRTLKIGMVARLTMTENGPGTASVTVKDESATIPDPIIAGSTGDFTAILGPMAIELEPIEVAPPITAPGGVRYHVTLMSTPLNCAKVVKSSRTAKPRMPWPPGFERTDAKWDVMQALTGRLAVRVEARASATAKGLSHAELLRYNQALSKKRLDAVVGRLKKTIEEKINTSSSIPLK